MVVEGPAGIGKSSLLRGRRARAEARGMAVLRARGGPLEQDAAWGVARQLFEPLRARPDWSELTAGAAALSRRALDPEAPEPAPAGDAMHAAVHGLVWLACKLAERAPALLVVDDVHWADAPSLRWLAQLARRLDELPLGVLCAVRAGEPPGARELLAELLAAAPEPPLRPRPLGPAAAETLVVARLPAAGAAFAHACHAVTAGNPFLLGALLAHLVAERIAPTERGRRPAERVRARAGRAQRRAPARAAARRRRRRSRARSRSSAAGRRCATPPGSRGLDPRAPRARWPTRCGRRARARRRAIALAHPLIAGALYGSLGPRRARAVARRRGPHARRRARRPRARRAAPAAHRAGRRPATVAALRAAAAGATARGAPESAAGFLRRALAEPPLDPRPPRPCGSSSDSRAPRTCSPTLRACSARRSSSPPRPSSASSSRCAGARARARRALPAGPRPLPPRARGRRERPGRSRAPRGRAGLQRLAAGRHGPRGRERLRRRRAPPARALARQRRLMQAMLDGVPPPRSLALLAPALATGISTARSDSLLPTVGDLRARSPTTSSTPRSRAAARSSTSRARAAG